MVRTRYPDSVKIQISGVKSIIPKSRIEIGRRSMTWLTFLNNVCGIELDSNKKYFICTVGYSPNHSIEGWTADLNDPIEQFVVRFSKKVRKYCVRLHKGCKPTQKKNGQIKTSKVQSQPGTPSSVTCTSPLASSPLGKPIKFVAARKFASVVPMKPSQLATETDKIILENVRLHQNVTVESNETKDSFKSDPYGIFEHEIFDIDDSENDIILSNTKEMLGPEPNDKNSEANNLVDIFEQQVDQLDGCMLEQIGQEIQKLRKSGLWERNLKRSPLAFCLLWEGFKD